MRQRPTSISAGAKVTVRVFCHTGIAIKERCDAGKRQPNHLCHARPSHGRGTRTPPARPAARAARHHRALRTGKPRAIPCWPGSSKAKGEIAASSKLIQIIDDVAEPGCDNGSWPCSPAGPLQPAAAPLRVLVAEDNDDLRDLLVTIISAEPDLECAGSAADVDTVLSRSRIKWMYSFSTSNSRVARASTCSETLRKDGNKIHIVVFSGHSHPEMIRHALAAGADAYVPKSGDYELLLDAIRGTRPAVAASAS